MSRFVKAKKREEEEAARKAREEKEAMADPLLALSNEEFRVIRHSAAALRPVLGTCLSA